MPIWRARDSVWKPSAYWQGYCKRITDELRRVGLAEFRDNYDLIKGYGTIPVKGAGTRLNRFLMALPVFDQLLKRYDELRKDALRIEAGHVNLLHAMLSLSDTARPILESVGDSCVGKPRSIEINGKPYTTNFLRRLILVAILADYGPIGGRICEIGGGYGVIPEIVIKWQPENLEYFVGIDIPPLVYIATQYLKAVFPGQVLDYRDVRDMDRIKATDVSGKILMIPPWSLPRLDLGFRPSLQFSFFPRRWRAKLSRIIWTTSVRAVSKYSSIQRSRESDRGRGVTRNPADMTWISEQIVSRNFIESTYRPDGPEVAALKVEMPKYGFTLFTRA